MKRHIMIAVPAYTGTVHVGTMRALIADIVGLLRRGDLMTLVDDIACCDLYDTRARSMAKFLESDCTDLMLIDNDVMWEAGAIPRLVDHAEDFVAGMYPKRQDPLIYDLQYLDDETKFLPCNPVNGLLEVRACSGGMMRVKRSVIERMVEHYKDDPVAGMYERDGRGKSYGLWDPVWIREDGKRVRKLGDDYSFCHRWKAMGGRIWIDPSFAMGHAGLKVFMGKFGDWIKAVPGTEEKAA